CRASWYVEAAMRTITRRQLLRDAAVAGLVVPFLAACGGRAASVEHKPAEEGAHEAAGEGHAAAEEHVAAGPHWTYEGSEGPDAWAKIDPSFASCSGGRGQSPVDLPIRTGGSALREIAFDYKPTHLNVTNNGHTVQVDYDPGSGMAVDGKRYDLVQFHFHVPSEHRLSGTEFPMEVHLVHRASDGSLAVIGAF